MAGAGRLAERVEEADGAGPGGDLPDACRPAPQKTVTSRHGCATLLLAKGRSGPGITEVPGPPETGVTMNTRAHVLPALRQEAADAMDDLSGT